MCIVVEIERPTMKKLNPNRITVEDLARLHSTEEIETLLTKLEAAREERQVSKEETKSRTIQEFLDTNEAGVTALDLMRWVEAMRPKLRLMAAANTGYVHPQDPSLVWIGKGRRPQWVTECLNSGYTLAQLERNPSEKSGSAGPSVVTDPTTGKTWSGRGRPPNWVKNLESKTA